MDYALSPPPLARQVNIGVVLHALRSGEAMTVNDLMELSGLTRATVHSICNDLVERGWILEVESHFGESSRPAGRPSRLFQLNRGAGCVVGIDVGDVHLGVIVANVAGEVLSDRRYDIAAGSTNARRESRIEALIDESLSASGVANRSLLGVGVGVAAPVSRDGVIGFGRDDPNPYWRKFRNDQKTIRKVFDQVPVLIENDANLAVLGERWRGIAHGVDDLIVLLAGERLGAGVMEAGRVLKGHRGGAGEMQWLDLVDGVPGADGFAHLARTWAREAVRSRRRSVLLDLAGGVREEITAEMVFLAAQQGDRIAVKVIDRLAETAAQIICMISMFLNPELVVLDGAVAGSADVLLSPIERELGKLVHDPPQVACSTLGDTVVAIGAVRLALDHVEAHALDITLRTTSLRGA